MAIDHSLALQVKSADPNYMLENGSRLAKFWLDGKTESELSRIYNESQGDLDKMLEVGQQSPMARWIMPQLQAQKSAQAQAQLETQKTLADIGNTRAQTAERYSSAGKNNADAGNTVQKTSDAKLDSARRAVFAGARNGNPQYIKMGLNEALSAGAIDQQTYNQFVTQIDALGNNPSRVAEYASNAILAGSQNPASFLFQTADNEANNATSQANNIRSTQASMYSTDVGAETADKNREQAAQKTELKDIGGYQAIYYPQTGEYDFVRDANGQPMKSQQKTAETMQQSMERKLSAQQAASMAQRAARAARGASDLINHAGLEKGTGWTAFSGKLPSGDAKAFQTDLENLKSQLFLPMIQQMRGMGALSNAEGAKVEAAIENLDVSINPQEMRRRLAAVAEQMNQLAQTSAKEAEIYSSGGGRLRQNSSTGSPNNKPSQQPYNQAKLDNILFGR